MLQIGMQAPDFTLPDKDGRPVTLSAFRGKKVVLYFYPKDKSADIEVIGISKDSVASHVKFAEKYNLPFHLLADPDRVAIEAYGVWQEKKMAGKVGMGVVRTTYIIDEDGVITAVMPKVKPDTNADEVLAALA